MIKLRLVKSGLLFGLGLSTATVLASETVTYSYDALGRLTTVVVSGGPNDGTEVTTAFDAAGNRTNHTVETSGGGGGGTILIPVSYSASSSYSASYTGLSGTGAGMRDGNYGANNTIHGTQFDDDAWIRMDLGSSKQVTKLVLAPINNTVPGGYGNWGPGYLNTSMVQYSSNGTSWTSLGNVTGATNGNTVEYPINQNTRYIRLWKVGDYIGVGDFYAVGP